MADTRPATWGQVAYDAYSQEMGGVSITGAKLLPFEECPVHIKDGWEKAAEAVISSFSDMVDQASA